MPTKGSARVRCILNPKVCETGVMPQIDRLTNLPAEIKNLIWKNLKEGADTTCLALTCKDMANSYNANKFSTSRLLVGPENRINFLLRLKEFSAHSKLRLCFHCRKFRLKKFKEGRWGGMMKHLQAKAVDRKMRIEGPNCPSCAKKQSAAWNKIINGNIPRTGGRGSIRF